jgi:type I restriction enzyme S subunit
MRLEMIKQLTAMPKYAAYKDSGVKWLGEIPAHWYSKRIKFLFKIGRGRVISQQKLDDSGAYPVYSSQTQNNGILGYINSYDFDCKQITWTTDGANAGTVFLREGKHNCTNVCGTMQPRECNLSLEFISNALSVATQYYKRPDTNGAKIMNGEMAEIFVPFPSLPEQTAIAAFLDRKIVQIDQAVAIKEKQIALLKERKQILIQSSVTRGLNPNVPMRDSGMDWIGDIPEHWEVKRLKYVLDERNERSKTGEEPLFMVSQVHGLVVRSEFHEKAEVAQSNIDNKIVHRNDLVFNKLKAHLGVFFKSNIEFNGLVSPDYAVYRSKGLISDLKYLEYLFRHPAYIGQFVIRATGIVEGLIRLYTGDLFEISVPVPPNKEQEKILNHIEIQSAKIDQAISIQQQQIDKLKEYKATLINSAVTGKIKVPELVEGMVIELAEAPMPVPVEGELAEDSVA